jgi:hypothetical protein
MTRRTDPLVALVRRWLVVPPAGRALLPVSIMGGLWWSSSREPVARVASAWSALLHNGMHVVAYGVLAGTCLLAVARAGAPPRRHAAWERVSFAIAVAYGIVDELHQSFVPGRVCSVADAMTNAAGALLGLLLVRALLGGTPALPRAVAAAALVCAACVAFATWGPW